MSSRWDQRFFASTKGQVAALLRRGVATVEELAQALGLTDNAVRSHLAALERDGLVAQSGVRRGIGKPAFTYALTPDAERLFPKAYGALLQMLLGVLAERLPPEVLDDVLRDTGRRLAAGHVLSSGDLRARVDGAVALLDELGGMAAVAAAGDGYVIQGCGCPLAAAVAGSPRACLLAETLLADVIGAPVRQVCDTADLRCRFEVGNVAAT
ncbi:MAG: ArsR family transcriptional regulator [Thermomicrobiales bacterium]